MLNGKTLIQSFQTCNIIGRSKNVCEGTMMAEEDEQKFVQKKWSTSEARPFVQRIPFVVQLVKPKILAK